MAQPPKHLLVYCVTGKSEGTYNSESAPSASTDAYYPQFSSTDQPEIVVEDLAYKGDLGPNSAGQGPNVMVAPSGRGATLVLPSYFWPAGIAYASGVKPLNNFHNLMLLCGYAATGSFTGGSEKWTYQMAADTVVPYSQTMYAYGPQVSGASTMELYKLFGGLGSLKMSFADPKPALFTATVKGSFGGDPTEVATPTPTLTGTPLPPLSTSVAFSYGSFSTGVVYSADFDLQRAMQPRVAQSNSGNHFGYVPFGHDPILNVYLERTLFATWNPYTIRAAAGSAALNLTLGSTQYFKIAFDAAQAQLVGDIKPVSKNGVACWQLQFHCPPSTFAGTDSHTWTAK